MSAGCSEDIHVAQNHFSTSVDDANDQRLLVMNAINWVRHNVLLDGDEYAAPTFRYVIIIRVHPVLAEDIVAEKPKLQSLRMRLKPHFREDYYV